MWWLLLFQMKQLLTMSVVEPLNQAGLLLFFKNTISGFRETNCLKVQKPLFLRVLLLTVLAIIAVKCHWASN
jgi:hypothetical protein